LTDNGRPGYTSAQLPVVKRTVLNRIYSFKYH
jgi:hypothetical protein